MLFQITYADVSWYENLLNLTNPESPTFVRRMPWFEKEARTKMLKVKNCKHKSLK